MHSQQLYSAEASFKKKFKLISQSSAQYLGSIDQCIIKNAIFGAGKRAEAEEETIKTIPTNFEFSAERIKEIFRLVIKQLSTTFSSQEWFIEDS